MKLSQTYKVGLALSLLAVSQASLAGSWLEEAAGCLQNLSVSSSEDSGAGMTPAEASAAGSGDYLLKQQNKPLDSSAIRGMRLQRDIYTEGQFELIDRILYKRKEMYASVSLSQLSYMAVTTKALVAPYNEYQMQRYDNYQDLRASGGPAANQELCLRQLDFLIGSYELEQAKGYQSKLSHLHDLLDTYGRPPAGLLEGNLLWLGLYDKCLRLRLGFPNELLPASSKVANQPEKTRYCLASLRIKDWPREKPWADFVAIKTGVCLPESCDSMNYKNKFELVRKLFEFNARHLDRAGAEVVNLYCLPDEQSSLRQWWRSPRTLATVSFLSVWLLLVSYCTYRDWTSLSTPSGDAANRKFSMTNGFRLTGKPEAEEQVVETKLNRLFRSLSVASNLRQLFDVEKKFGSLLESQTSLGGSSALNQIDLSVLDGIKVILMVYVIMGHILMGLSQMTENCAEMATEFKLIFYTTNLAPAFAVNGFFTITGLLTAYLLLKANQSQPLVESPLKWLALIAYRYLRIMPMYLLVVLYGKALAKFAGSGPLWDYGTSGLAPRKRCEQEPWLVSLLFLANFKSPLSHCVVSAWYLANDFQFFLLTPIFILLLHKNARAGKLLLFSCILLGYAAGFYKIYTTDWHDFRPIASFQAHGLQTVLAALHSYYTQPQYRIPAYLCGLLLGHALFAYDQPKDDVSSSGRKWPELFVRRGSWLSLSLLAFCMLAPIVATFIQFNKPLARLAVAALQPALHIAFSLGAGLYILLAATGNGSATLNSFLSAPLWKPLARLSLCAVLVNMDVINYIMQTMRHTQIITNFYYLALNVLCILATYFMSVILCVLFEAPIRSLLNTLVSHAARSMVRKRRAEGAKQKSH